MHKEDRDYKYAEQRRDECCCCYEGLRCEEGGELSSRNAQKGNGALKRHGTESIKGKRTESARSVQKTLMQTEQRSVAEQ
jgi:hypothetical protein